MREHQKKRVMLSFFDYLAKRPFFFRVRIAEAETLILAFLPSTITVFFWMFGLKTLRVLRWEKLTLWPYILPLPVISQIAIILFLKLV